MQAGSGDEGDVLVLETRRGQESGHLILDLVESFLGPSYHVQLVDGHNDAGDPHAANQEGMLLSLAPQPGFESTGAGIDDEDGEVGLTGSSNHVRDKIFVTRGIEDREGRVLRLEPVGGDVYRDSSAAFFGRLVQDPGERKRALADGFCLLPEPVDRALVDNSEIEKQPAHHGALSRVHVPDHDKTGTPFAAALFEFGNYVEISALGQRCIVDLQLVYPRGDGRRGLSALLLGLRSRLLAGCIDY